MKIAISSSGKDLDSQIDPRFGRCQYFIFIDSETMKFEVSENEGLMASGGAGVRPHNLLPKEERQPSSQATLDPMRHQPFQLQGLRFILYLVGWSKMLLRAIEREVSVRPVEQQFLPTLVWEGVGVWVEVAEVFRTRLATDDSPLTE